MLMSVFLHLKVMQAPFYVSDEEQTVLSYGKSKFMVVLCVIHAYGCIFADREVVGYCAPKLYLKFRFMTWRKGSHLAGYDCS